MQLILLAAGRGSRLPKKFRSKPKCLSIINKRTILEHNLKFYQKFDNRCIVTGYKSILLKKFAKKNNFKIIHNKKFSSTNMVYSMLLTKKLINQDAVICYGDIIFNPSLYNLLQEKKNIMPLNINWLKIWKKRMTFKEIKKDAESVVVKKSNLVSIGNPIIGKLPKLQYMGIFKIQKKIIKKMSKLFSQLKEDKIDMTSFLNKSITNNIVKFQVKKYKSYWYEIDNYKDLKVATKELT
jgi:L-glutamine-phosphate cytidylyltransferase